MVDFKQLENTDRVISTLQYNSSMLILGCERGKIIYFNTNLMEQKNVLNAHIDSVTNLLKTSDD